MSASTAVSTDKYSRAGQSALDTIERKTNAYIADSVMMVGRAIFIAVLILVILGALYNTSIVANPDNPNVFTNMTDTFGTYGTTAFTMIGLGLIAAGGWTAMRYFGGFGGNGGR